VTGVTGDLKKLATPSSFYRHPSEKNNRYQRDKKLKRCQRRAAIEPIIGHLKTDYRMARNFLKGTAGDLINVLMAALAWNLNLWMRVFLSFILECGRHNLLFKTVTGYCL